MSSGGKTSYVFVPGARSHPFADPPLHTVMVRSLHTQHWVLLLRRGQTYARRLNFLFSIAVASKGNKRTLIEHFRARSKFVSCRLYSAGICC